MQLCYVNARQLRQLEDCSSFWLTWQQQVSISFSHGNKSQKFNYTVFGFFLLLPPVWCYWQQAL
jgi:hypothetical protein